MHTQTCGCRLVRGHAGAVVADFGQKHRLPVIEEVAAACRDDLAGQTSPGAEFELLERLVRQRLDELSPSDPG